MRVGSMCSGIDGLALGLEAHGMETAWQVEIDPYARSQLALHWPDVPRYEDLTATDWTAVDPVDVVCVGYPCQPFSHAGRRKGTDDERHLWPHIRDAVRVLRPRYVFAENVRGHLSLGFHIVLADLAALGYCVRWQVLRASDVGAPHRRERLFWLATDAVEHASGLGQPGGLAGTSGPGGSEGPERQRNRDAAGRGGATAADASHVGPLGPGLEASRRGDADRRLVVAADANGVARPPGRELERRPGALDEPGPVERVERLRSVDWGRYAAAIRRWERIIGRPAPDPLDERGRLNPDLVEFMMGFPEGWTVGKRTDRLRCYGNAVVPQVSAAAWGLLAPKAVAA